MATTHQSSPLTHLYNVILALPWPFKYGLSCCQVPANEKAHEMTGGLAFTVPFVMGDYRVKLWEEKHIVSGIQFNSSPFLDYHR